VWRACLQCGRDFFADEEWKRLCLPCWKHKNLRGPRDDPALLRRVRELERECDRLEDALYEARRRTATADIDLAFCRLLCSWCTRTATTAARPSNEATKRLLELKSTFT
jgi:hypothetical protein